MFFLTGFIQIASIDLVIYTGRLYFLVSSSGKYECNGAVIAQRITDWQDGSKLNPSTAKLSLLVL